ncbi:energy transducer TonB [Erythrobacter donghaensis]|uniref:energy transducer TonB n=1 Tax=Erythrobacter donghaensis TaxID=267135 RepID=UPI0018C6E5C3|nr:energy transducer TonB [Erythrobacter donghaensis]
MNADWQFRIYYLNATKLMHPTLRDICLMKQIFLAALGTVAAAASAENTQVAVQSLFDTPAQIVSEKGAVSVQDCQQWSTNLNSLPDNFAWFADQTLAQQPVRGEFETATEYAARVQSWKVGSRIWLNAGFEIDPDDFTYDPDREVLRLTPTNAIIGGESEFDDLGTYVGANAFGVTREVRRRKLHSRVVSIEGYDHVMPQGREIPMDRETAADLEKNGRLHVLGYLRDTDGEFSRGVPTLDRPSDFTLSRKILFIVPVCFAVVHRGQPVDGLQWLYTPDAPATPARLRGNAAQYMAEELTSFLRRDTESGSAVWTVSVDELGRARSCRLVRSSFGPEKDEKICRIIARYARFEPANVNGLPFASEFTSTIKLGPN